ncbi:hypothetical protein FNU76_13415 [Chitinimonas arctica]|uniref:Uncharacterized protein n=1 Tax=Chitinimonas arctica TaxID=2594795 RepID=A0A516SGJ8_9NEIS|nr:hypothetical protein [Chitinimonas arctica]QDQ27283.1 hypothetical protein FNU76_13415 [Chitinimonas arctica]
MNLAKLGYVVGAFLFILLIQAGLFSMAMMLLGAAVLWGAWRIWCFVAEAREREARQWQVDETLLVPKKKPSRPSR